MLFQRTAEATLVVSSLIGLTSCLEITRNVTFNDETINENVVVDAGKGVSFLSTTAIPISMDGDITNNGVFCFGFTNHGKLTSSDIMNYGQMFLGVGGSADGGVLNVGDLYNYNYLSFTGSDYLTLVATGNFVNEGYIDITAVTNGISLTGPTGGIINNGVITATNMAQSDYKINAIVGTGCIVNSGFSQWPEFDLSQPFNQTIYNESPVMWAYFGATQSPNSIPVIRGLSSASKGSAQLLIGSVNPVIYPQNLIYKYDTATGRLNFTANGRSFLFDIGLGFDPTQFSTGGCQGKAGTYACITYEGASLNEKIPSNCQINIQSDLTYETVCPAATPLPPPITSTAPYYSETIEEIISYSSFLDSDGLPTTTSTTTYVVPTLVLPPPYLTTTTKSATTVSELVSYSFTHGAISGMPALSDVPMYITTTSTIPAGFSIPPPYTTTVITDSMAVSELVSFYSTDSDSTPMTGTTTITFPQTRNVTTTVTEYLMGTTHLSKVFTSTGTWQSTSTYSTTVETYVIRTESTGVVTSQI